MAHEEGFASLLAAAKAGQDWAWREIYGRLSPPLLGYLRARGAPEPEDVLGELFLQLVRDVERFEGGEREFRAWAFTVAHHRLIDDRRRRLRRPVQAAPDAELAPTGAASAAEEEALKRAGDPHLRAALGRLSDEQRSVLLLRLLGDLSVDEVAKTLRKSPGAVKALQRRALARLASELSELGVTL